MSQYEVKEPPEELIPEDEAANPQALFPDVFAINDLKTDKQFPLLKFVNLQNHLTTQKKSIGISVEVPKLNKYVDLYLFINDKKRDMFYKITDGIYTFKEVELVKGENLIELFYRIGRKKSSSIYCIINRE